MTFSTLPEEIKIEILSFLNLGQLSIVADVSTEMRRLVRADLRYLEGMKDLEVKHFEDREDSITLYQNRIKISGLRVILGFIRIFGDRVETLEYNARNAFESTCLRVIYYVRRFSIKIRHLFLYNITYDISRGWLDGFHNVQTLAFSNCTVCQGICDFNMFFPRLRSLTFYGYNRIENERKILIVYPNIVEIFVYSATMVVERVNRLRELNPSCRIEWFD